MNFHPRTIDIAAGLSYVAGGSFAAAAIALSTAFPNQATKILAFAAIATPLAGLLVRLFFNQTDKPAVAVVEDAPIVTAGTNKPTEATVVSTTSTVFEPKAAP